MKEIGGYFGLEELIHNEYYSELIPVNNARSALLYLLKARRIQKLYIPFFLCDSVSDMCTREGYSFAYYHIDEAFLPVFEETLGKDEYLYIVNYYGQIGNETILALKDRYQNIIFDNVQAFFQKPVEGVDTLYSCRKFFGVPDGGYVSTSIRLQEELPIDISMSRMRHVLGRYEGESASDYYADFKKNDASFKTQGLCSMSKLTHNILGAIDYEAAKKKRTENYDYLQGQIGALNQLTPKRCDGPYAYPFYYRNGMQLKKQLAENKIYVATLWPNVLEMENTLEKDFAENILPLPIDQRYGIEDMREVVQAILKCTEN